MANAKDSKNEEKSIGGLLSSAFHFRRFDSIHFTRYICWCVYMYSFISAHCESKETKKELRNAIIQSHGKRYKE